MNQSNNVKNSTGALREQISLGSLIVWNVSKAVETNPNIDVKCELKTAQQRLERDSSNVNSYEWRSADQYLTCAMLAWQQLGHTDADSLHKFLEMKCCENKQSPNVKELESQRKSKKNGELLMSPGSFISYETRLSSKGSLAVDCDTLGPVLRLPVQTKTVLRVDPVVSALNKRNTLPAKSKEGSTIKDPCCLNSACLEQLTLLEKSTKELRLRAQNLAKREAQRVELLERAESAWKDLEKGYQRRLGIAEEKEEDITKLMQKLIEERNAAKSVCSTLAKQLREKGDRAEQDRERLSEVENEAYNLGSQRDKLRNEAMRLDAQLNEQQCKASQLDRDLQFKEEQARRGLMSLESDIESERVLTCDAERALRFEVRSLKEQIQIKSTQLLEEGAIDKDIQIEIEQLQQEKMEMVEDLEGCKVLCDGRIQGKIDELKRKRDQLNELTDIVMECKCKLPTEAAVQVKRTPSLAALCRCTPEDRFLESCSCSSLRTTLMSNFLSDLFSGLQTEMSDCAPQMPCQMLKCLEDKHNWDKASVVKTNLRKYFSQLLIGELDIAIATSIEKYHARWVGASCVDACRMMADHEGPENEQWQERVLERRAHQLAAKLAEQLFKDKADLLTAKAKQILRTGPPPCECKPKVDVTAAVCLVKPPVTANCPLPDVKRQSTKTIVQRLKPIQPVALSTGQQTNGTQSSKNATTSAVWRKAHQDVMQLKVQLEDLKKDTIKKEDLRMLKSNIVQIVQRSIYNQKEDIENLDKTKYNNLTTHKAFNTVSVLKQPLGKVFNMKKKPAEKGKITNKNIVLGLLHEKSERPQKAGLTYSINMCLCRNHKNYKVMHKKLGQEIMRHSEKMLKITKSKSTTQQLSSDKQIKSVSPNSLGCDTRYNNKDIHHSLCRSSVACFHKPPSNTSIDNLFAKFAISKCAVCKLDELEKCKIKDDAKTNIISKNSTIDYNKINVNCAMNNVQEYITNKSLSAQSSTEVIGIHKLNENIFKDTEMYHTIPLSTQSEFMGTINLEKSIFNLSKSFNTKVKNNELSIINNTRTQEASTGKKQNNQGLHDVTTGEACVSNKVILKKDLLCDELNIKKTSLYSSNNCNQGIKFLGVTLACADSKNIINADCSNLKTHNIANLKESNVWPKNSNIISIDGRDRKNYVNKNYVSPKIDCSLFNYNSARNLKRTLGVDNKQQGDCNIRKDKNFDTRSLQEEIVPKSCICCVENMEESRDLEINTFNLIEEYLRNKWTDFKTVNCESCCIAPEVEETMYFTILAKVKQIILDTTKNLSCKCQNSKLGEGSWKRAYNLLQEYLKIKIKRVECLCSPSENNKDTVLSIVMDKVNHLIESDFKRLKELCRCENNNNIKNNKHFIDRLNVPEKDTNVVLPIEEKHQVPVKICSENRKSLYNTSTQVSAYFGMQDKSCSIEDNDNIYKDSSSHKDENIRQSQTNDQCLNTILEDELNNEVILLQKHAYSATDDYINKDKIMNENEKKMSPTEADIPPKICLPYIGYTVNCSCDQDLGKCRCTKSLAGYNENIYSIWNTLTSNKLNHLDNSYIMNAVTNVSNVNHERDNQVTEKKSEKQIRLLVRNKNTSADADEEITLKVSKSKLNKTYLSKTTSNDNIIIKNDERTKCCNCHTEIKSHKNFVISNGTDDEFVDYRVNNLKNRGRSEVVIKSNRINLPTYFNGLCECNMVPLCHVKMLVGNIEKKIYEAKCTCDSLSSKVCPVHSETISEM